MIQRRPLPLVMLVALACESAVSFEPPPTAQLQAANVVTVEIVPAKATMFALGDTLPLLAKPLDEMGNPVAAAVRWRSIDTLIATVEGEGLVVSRAAGRARIRAHVGAGAATISGLSIVTVRQIAASIAVAGPDTLRAIADTASFTAVVHDSNGVVIQGINVRWRSVDTAVVSISAAGVATAGAPGTARIRAEYGGLRTQVLVVVRIATPPVASVAMQDTSIVLPGDTIQLTAVALDSAQNTLAVTLRWTSLSADLLTVSRTGQAIANGVGIARVKVVAGTLVDIGTVLVGTGAIGRVVLAPVTDTIRSLGGTLQLAATATSPDGSVLVMPFSWRVPRGSAVRVDQNGLVTGRLQGDGTVIVSAAGVEDTTVVHVVQTVSSLTMEVSRTNLRGVGDTARITVGALDPGGSALTRYLPDFIALDPGVVVAMPSSRRSIADAFAVSEGTGRIVAVYDGVADTVEFVVRTEATRIRIDAPTLVVVVADTLQLVAIATDLNGVVVSSSEPVAWQSLNPAFALVDSTGAVVGVAAGTANIVATVGSYSGSLQLDVRATQRVPTTVTIRAPVSVALDRSVTLSAKVLDEVQTSLPGATVVWHSLTPAIAAIGQDGRVTPLAIGEARIEAVAAELTDTATLTVLTRDTRPNIVFILTDDQELSSWTHLPYLQSEVVSKGTLYTNFMVTQPVCCPSRASFLRGQYPTNHHIIYNLPPQGGWDVFHALGHEESTVATWLHDAGYKTALVGKYLNHYQTLGPQIPSGWDEWKVPTAGPLPAVGMADEDEDDEAPSVILIRQYYNYMRNENGVLRKRGSRPEDYRTDVEARDAGAFISTAVDEGRPFLLYLTPAAPHEPALPAVRHVGTLAGIALSGASINEEDISDKPAAVNTRPPLTLANLDVLAKVRQKRTESLLAVDDMIKLVVDSLAATGVLDNTYIIFTSDNGYHIGEHRLLPGKRFPYDEDVRVGLAVRGPGVPAGRVASDIVLNNDIAPTLADIAGVAASIPAFVDGRSVLPSFLGAVGTRRAGMIGNWYTGSPGIPNWQQVRTLTHAYVEWENGDRELYDMIADPFQLTNIYSLAEPALISSLAARLARLRACAGAGCRAEEDRQ